MCITRYLSVSNAAYGHMRSRICARALEIELNRKEVQRIYMRLNILLGAAKHMDEIISIVRIKLTILCDQIIVNIANIEIHVCIPKKKV